MAAVNMGDDQLRQLLQAVRGGGNAPERESKLKPFESGDATEWLQWRKRFEILAEGKGWDPAQQVRAIRQSMMGYAVDATGDIEVGEIAANAALGIAHRAALTPVQVLNAYEAKFVTAAGTTKARDDFLAAHQGQQETVSQWHTRVKMLYRRAHPQANAETSHELLEKFQYGLWNGTVCDRTLTDRPLNMTQALDRASHHVATLSALRRRGIRQRNELGGGSLNFMGSAAGNGGPTTNGNPHAHLTCHGCKEKGHIRRNCSKAKKGKDGSSRGEKTKGFPKKKKQQFSINCVDLAKALKEELLQEKETDEDNNRTEETDALN